MSRKGEKAKYSTRHSRHYGWHENKAIYEEFRSLRQSPTDFDVMMHGIAELEKHINA